MTEKQIIDRREARRRYDKTPKGRDTKRRQRVRRAYGLAPGLYREMEAKAGGICPLCKEARKLAVDHNHITKAVRGLLCIRCNSFLGVVEKYPHWVGNAETYLKGE